MFAIDSDFLLMQPMNPDILCLNHLMFYFSSNTSYSLKVTGLVGSKIQKRV